MQAIGRMDKEILKLKDQLKRTMLEILTLAPGEAWTLICQVQKDVLNTEIESRAGPERRAS